MTMTVPQIIMLNHAAWVNWKRSEARAEAKTKEKQTQEQRDIDDPIVYRGKRLGELNSEEMANYYGFGSVA